MSKLPTLHLCSVPSDASTTTHTPPNPWKYGRLEAIADSKEQLHWTHYATDEDVKDGVVHTSNNTPTSMRLRVTMLHPWQAELRIPGALVPIYGSRPSTSENKHVLALTPNAEQTSIDMLKQQQPRHRSLTCDDVLQRVTGILTSIQLLHEQRISVNGIQFARHLEKHKNRWLIAPYPQLKKEDFDKEQYNDCEQMAQWVTCLMQSLHWPTPTQPIEQVTVEFKGESRILRVLSPHAVIQEVAFCRDTATEINRYLCARLFVWVAARIQTTSTNTLSSAAIVIPYELWMRIRDAATNDLVQSALL